jgi:hypothetical protein
VVGDANDVTLLLNGVAGASTAIDSYYYPSNFYQTLENFALGKSWDAVNEYSNMNLYNFKIFNTAFTSAELAFDAQDCLEQICKSNFWPVCIILFS